MGAAASTAPSASSVKEGDEEAPFIKLARTAFHSLGNGGAVAAERFVDPAGNSFAAHFQEPHAELGSGLSVSVFAPETAFAIARAADLLQQCTSGSAQEAAAAYGVSMDKTDGLAKQDDVSGTNVARLLPSPGADLNVPSVIAALGAVFFARSIVAAQNAEISRLASFDLSSPQNQRVSFATLHAAVASAREDIERVEESLVLLVSAIMRMLLPSRNLNGRVPVFSESAAASDAGELMKSADPLDAHPLVLALQCECLDLLTMLLERETREYWFVVTTSASAVDAAISALARSASAAEVPVGLSTGEAESTVRIRLIARLLRMFASRREFRQDAEFDAFLDSAPTGGGTGDVVDDDESASYQLSAGSLLHSAVGSMNGGSPTGSFLVSSPVTFPFRLLARCGQAYAPTVKTWWWSSGQQGRSSSHEQTAVGTHASWLTNAPASDKALNVLLLLLSSERKTATDDIAEGVHSNASVLDSPDARLKQPWRIALHHVHDPEYEAEREGSSATYAPGREATDSFPAQCASARAIVDAIGNNTSRASPSSSSYVPIVFDSSTVLLLYYLMRDFVPFAQHTVSRTDLCEALVLPLCQLCYVLTQKPPSGRQSASASYSSNEDQQRKVVNAEPAVDDLYLCVVCLLLLTEERDVTRSLFAMYLADSRDILFFAERPQLKLAMQHQEQRAAKRAGDSGRRSGWFSRDLEGADGSDAAPLSVGSVTLMCLARAVQLNLARIATDDGTPGRRVAHVHHAALAAMSNLMPWAQDLHPYAAFRLVKLFDHVGRRHARAVAADRAREVTRYEDVLHLLFKMVNSTLTTAMSSNRHLVFALLYHQDSLQRWFGSVGRNLSRGQTIPDIPVEIAVSIDPTAGVAAAASAHERYAELARNLFATIEFFNARVVLAASKNTPNDANKLVEERLATAGSHDVALAAVSWSPADVLSIIDETLNDRSGLVDLELEPFGQLSFRYQEESHPQDFFQPFAQRVVVPYAVASNLLHHYVHTNGEIDERSERDALVPQADAESTTADDDSSV